ncbi:expressed unknown protein [Seminavis robusta]|uniref:Uncharacterized protein n=1 Tax=Seminavis robusta TaxID=568900 RepID=A0A9N8EX19_9STRA|nr:expressed unknown protein [Seminavis robusta]|eukprot:Sro2329_g323500.1 n/a (691) ;mRNA; r:720-2873
MKGSGENVDREHATVRRRREELDRLKEKQQQKRSTGASAGIRGPRAAGPPRGAPPPPRVAVGNGPPLGGPPKQAASPVARKLEFAKGRSPAPPSSRARSAPPTRPPPPPGPPPMAKEAPDFTPSKHLAPPTPSRDRSPGRAPPTTPARGFAARPPPTTFGSKPKAAPGAPPIMPVTPRGKPPSPVVTRPVVAPVRPPSPTVVNLGLPKPEALSDGPPKPTNIQPRAPSPTVINFAPAPMPMADGPPRDPSPAMLNAKPVSVLDGPPTAPEIVTVGTKSEISMANDGPLSLAPELVVEKEDTASKPIVPIQSRRNMIQTLALGADTPAKIVPPTSDNTAISDSPAVAAPESSLLRLEKEVREHEKAKADALRRVALLEEQLQKFKEKGDASDQLGTLLAIADRDGDASALHWARASASGETPKAMSQTSFFSPLSPGLATPRAGSHKRAPTPRPKLDKGDGNEQLGVDLFGEAVKCTPFEFTTDLATFIVRRPHDMATERELWFTSGYANAKKYARQADVRKPYTLEVVAIVAADSSTLTLSSNSDVRHNNVESDEWKEFGNVDKMLKPLGTVTYIDTDAVEKDYSLDEIYEGAVSARETYCTSVMSMALGLKVRGPAVNQAPAPSPVPLPTKKPVQTSEIGVNTDDLPIPAASQPGAPKAPEDLGNPSRKFLPRKNRSHLHPILMMARIL